ncbi:MAG: hypothetical protein AB7T08_10620, partial [Hyphomonadaceae bacterium]
MVNVVLLHAPEDEARARRIAQAWEGGRATLCAMGPHRRRIALGARSVLIGLWSDASEIEEKPGENRALQMAGVLSQSAPRALLVVWDGRPPLEAATAAGVPVIVAPEGDADLMGRLQTAAAELLEGQAIVSDLGDRARRPARSPTAQGSRSWGLAIGILIGVLAVLGGLAPFAA